MPLACEVQQLLERRQGIDEPGVVVAMERRRQETCRSQTTNRGAAHRQGVRGATFVDRGALGALLRGHTRRAVIELVLGVAHQPDELAEQHIAALQRGAQTQQRRVVVVLVARWGSVSCGIHASPPVRVAPRVLSARVLAVLIVLVDVVRSPAVW
jgi:hypothetical protein